MILKIYIKGIYAGELEKNKERFTRETGKMVF